MTVTNTGQAGALAVTPASPLAIVGPPPTLLTAPGPVPSLAGGGSASFTWTYEAAAPGSVQFTTTVTGTVSSSEP